MFFFQLLIAAGVIGTGVAVAVPFFNAKSEPDQTEPVAMAALVETVAAKKEDKTIVVQASGKVQPHRELTVFAEVKGRIIQQAHNLDPGGILKKNEIILKLDPRDYIDAVEQARSLVEKSEFELIVEKGKKMIAEKEWELLDSSLKQGGVGKNLALRIPHLREKEAALQAAISRLNKAITDLKRTIIRAPFNALVMEEFIEVGQVLAPQTKVAVLVSTDQYRVLIGVPYDQLAWIKIPVNADGTGTPVQIIQEFGASKAIARDGHVLRLMGNLDPNGRMAQLLVVIDDPLGLEEKGKAAIPLLIGSSVKVRINGPVVKDVFELPQSAIHESNKVWVKNKENRLEIKPVKILSEGEDTVLVLSGIEEGEEIVTSSLPVAIPGMLLENANEEKRAAGDDTLKENF